MMKKEVFDHASDECLLDVVNGTATYGRCDIRQFPFCSGDTPHICFNRINRRDAFWPDKHPKYYIDYNRIHCYPDQLHGVDFTCSSCSPGRWCVPEGRCILDENKVRFIFAMSVSLLRRIPVNSLNIVTVPLLGGRDRMMVRRGVSYP